MTGKKTILAVDDSSMNHKLIKRLVGDRYQLMSAFSGLECLQKVKSTLPDLILLDVTMPDMDGYQTCRALREYAQTADIPILFLSGRCSVEEKLRGYQVGGDDYLTKPFDNNEVLIKIEKNLATREAHLALQKQAQKVSKLAFHALNESSNLGICLRFLEATHLCNDATQLLELAVGTAKALGINAVVKIAADGLVLTDDALLGLGKVSELEETLLSKLEGVGQYTALGSRLVVHEGEVILLVKNMPVEQTEIYDVLKQHMYTLCRGINARMQILISQEQVRQQQNLYLQIIERTHTLLKNTDTKFHEVVQGGSSAVEEMAADVEKEIISGNDLSEYQEKAISCIADKAVKRMESMHSEALKIDEAFTVIVSELEKANRLGKARHH